MAGSSSTTTTTGAGSTISAVCPTAIGRAPRAQTRSVPSDADSTSIRRVQQGARTSAACCLRCGCDALRGAGRAPDGLRRRRASRLPGAWPGGSTPTSTSSPTRPPSAERPACMRARQRRLGGARRRAATGELRRRAPPRTRADGMPPGRPAATLPAGRRPARAAGPTPRRRRRPDRRTGGRHASPGPGAQPPPLGAASWRSCRPACCCSPRCSCGASARAAAPGAGEPRRGRRRSSPCWPSWPHRSWP